jgi:hypothetical protein
LARSNHTSVYYEPHNAIYVFGGGQQQKMRFNDTLRVQLTTQEGLNFNQELKPPVSTVELVQLTSTIIPEARTYHASCLVDRFMVVVGGEAHNTDMNDIWALDLHA